MLIITLGVGMITFQMGKLRKVKKLAQSHTATSRAGLGMKPVLGPPCRPCCLPLQVPLLRAGTDTTNTREQSGQAKRGQLLEEGDIRAWP